MWKIQRTWVTAWPIISALIPVLFMRAYRNTETSDSGFGSGSSSSSYSHDLSMDGIEGQKTWKIGDHTLISGVTYNQEHIKEENNAVAFDKSMISKAVYVEDNGSSVRAGRPTSVLVMSIRIRLAVIGRPISASIKVKRYDPCVYFLGPGR